MTSEHSASPRPAAAVTQKSAYHHGDLRAQLISAVRDLVETHGPDGFSVSEAARQAGVSTAAPYKHFKDRQEILRGVVAEAIERLRNSMEEARDSYPAGSLEAVAAIGQAYVDFAKSGPGVFRLVFGLTAGHEDDPELMKKGQSCFGVVAGAAAARLRLPVDEPDVQRRAYMLWSFVHGHSFLTIDRKNSVSHGQGNDWDYLMDISRAILGDRS